MVQQRRSNRLARGPGAGWLALLLGVAVLGAAVAPRPARAQAVDRNAEARVFFERGNRLLQQAMRRRGARRAALLEEALREYVSALRIVRSRNALFNAAVTLELLGRHEEAFAYWSEYLRVPGLSEQERAEGERRRDALRQKVAVVAVEGEPEGAEVRIDRLDLAPAGTVPLEVAVRPGEHVLYVSKAGYERREHRVQARRGERVVVRVDLPPRPVELLVEAPEPGRLTVDGRPARPGEPVALPPGRHRVRFEPRGGGEPIEQVVTLRPGSEPVRLRLRAAPTRLAALRVETDAVATIVVDGERLGEGRSLRLELPAGRHRVRLEGSGGRSWEGTVVLRPGGERLLRAEGLREPGPGTTFWVLASAGAVALASGLVVGVLALDARAEYDRLAAACGTDPVGCQRAEVQADRVDALNLAADLLGGGGLLLGAVAAWLYFGGGAGERPVQVAPLPLPGGAGLALRWEGRP